MDDSILCAWRLHLNTRNQAKGMLEVLRLAVWIQSLIRESVCDLPTIITNLYLHQPNGWHLQGPGNEFQSKIDPWRCVKVKVGPKVDRSLTRIKDSSRPSGFLCSSRPHFSTSKHPSNRRLTINFHILWIMFTEGEWKLMVKEFGDVAVRNQDMKDSWDLFNQHLFVSRNPSQPKVGYLASFFLTAPLPSSLFIIRFTHGEQTFSKHFFPTKGWCWY